MKNRKKTTRFKAKTYLRLSAVIGSILGVMAMIAAAGMGRNLVGAALCILFTGVGIIVGIVLEGKA